MSAKEPAPKPTLLRGEFAGSSYGIVEQDGSKLHFIYVVNAIVGVLIVSASLYSISASSQLSDFVIAYAVTTGVLAVVITLTSVHALIVRMGLSKHNPRVDMIRGGPRPWPCLHPDTHTTPLPT